MASPAQCACYLLPYVPHPMPVSPILCILLPAPHTPRHLYPIYMQESRQGAMALCYTRISLSGYTMLYWCGVVILPMLAVFGVIVSWLCKRLVV